MDIKEKVLNNRKNGMAMMLLFIIFYAHCRHHACQCDYRVDSAYATGDHLDFHRLDPVSGT